MLKVSLYHETLKSAFAKHYQEQSDVWSAELAMRIFPSIIVGSIKGQPFPLKKVLDIGCGAGDDCQYVSKISEQIVGIDLYQHPNWETVQAENPNIQFIHTDFATFDTELKFDLILDNGCFHHQHPNYQLKYLNKVCNLLNEDGYFGLSTFKNDNKSELWDSNGRLHKYFSDEELLHLMNCAGFSMFKTVTIYRIQTKDYYRFSVFRPNPKTDFNNNYEKSENC